MTTSEVSMSILTPSEGYVLYNESAKILADKIYCPESQESNWTEVTKAEAAELQASWDAEREAELKKQEEVELAEMNALQSEEEESEQGDE